MDKIMSAEEFIDDIGKILVGGWRDSAADYVGSYSAACEKAKDLLRSRDKAIVERIRGRLRWREANNLLSVGIRDVEEICDDVLRELGGE